MKKMTMMMLVVICLISCNNESDTPEPKRKQREDIPLTRAEEKIVANNNDFAFNLFRKITETNKQDHNLFISPLSVTVAFSMLNNGAASITKDEIQEALGYKDLTLDEINEFYKKILKAAVDIDPQINVSMANSIWIRNGFSVLTPFTDVNKNSYDAEVRNIDFSQPQALHEINQWVSAKTNGIIPQMLDRIEPEQVMFLINALYFKGEWSDPFKKNATHDEVFKNGDGSTTIVPMMNKSMQGVYAGTDEYSLTMLPYGNGAFQMIFILPDEGVELSSVVADLTDSSWQECLQQNGVPCTVKLKLPRFKTNYNIELNDILKALGMQSAFDRQADFSLISNDPIYITLAQQKAQIEVNEEGTEAVASTVVGGLVTSPGPPPGGIAEFYMDRPFMYFIREISTNTVFFMGKIEQM